jgi:hypothetical protein
MHYCEYCIFQPCFELLVPLSKLASPLHLVRCHNEISPHASPPLTHTVCFFFDMHTTSKISVAPWRILYVRNQRGKLPVEQPNTSLCYFTSYLHCGCVAEAVITLFNAFSSCRTPPHSRSVSLCTVKIAELKCCCPCHEPLGTTQTITIQITSTSPHIQLQYLTSPRHVYALQHPLFTITVEGFQKSQHRFPSMLVRTTGHRCIHIHCSVIRPPHSRLKGV